MLPYIVWTLTIVLTLVGTLGVIVPLLPGTTLILVGMFLHKLFLPADLAWTTVGIIAFIWLLSLLIDFGGVAIGARLFGGGKWGMAGATGGAMVGMFFSLPALIIGTIIGATAAEKYVAKKSGQVAIKSGIGAAVGFLISTIGRLFCAAGMIAVFLIAVFSAGDLAGN